MRRQAVCLGGTAFDSCRDSPSRRSNSGDSGWGAESPWREQFSEYERDLFFGNARPVVPDTDFVPIGARSFDMNPDLGNDARFLASVE